jgi:hypothetical protein
MVVVALAATATSLTGCTQPGRTDSGAAPMPSASTATPTSATSDPPPSHRPSNNARTRPAIARSASASSPMTGTHRLQRCHTSDLTGQVADYDGGMGQRYAGLGLTNTTARSCTIYGYPGLQLVDAYGRNRQTRTSWIRSTAPTRLVVRPGQTVWALLHWTVVEADEEEWANDCAPDPAALRVIPPDETTQLSMAFGAGRLCQHGDITVGAFRRDRPADG